MNTSLHNLLGFVESQKPAWFPFDTCESAPERKKGNFQVQIQTNLKDFFFNELIRVHRASLCMIGIET